MRRSLLLLCSFLLALTAYPHQAAHTDRADQHGFKALVFTKTAGFRHQSISAGIRAIQGLSVEHEFDADFTEDAALFTDANLATYDVVIFLNTTGDVLNEEQQQAFERFIQAGNGFVGVHSASDTEYDWPFYGGMIGAYFESHPSIQAATVNVVDREHPSTRTLPERWGRTDEWYNFRSNPRGSVHVLATLAAGSYQGSSMGADHPIAWCHAYEGGRSWYTAGGHTSATYSEPGFLDHLINGIEWAAGVIPGDCGGTVWGNFDKEVLDPNTANPMDLEVAPDGRVFFIERAGQLRIYDPGTQTTSTAGQLSVHTNNEDGLVGIALDPDFATTNWVYLFYSPAGGEPRQHVSRFTMNGRSLDRASERLLLEIPVQRDECCHTGGALEFDAAGHLYISTGDNTNPFASDGFAPIDERPGRSPWDAQKSSSNTNDLRGKVLRITPQADGTYTIPEGNLFAPGTPDTRPEIYVMGARNPFRISVDARTGWLYWGEVGPDARATRSARGPLGHDEWNQVREAGNYGWPYCLADNKPYVDYDFATSRSGGAFSCERPVNESPNNTGLTELPPARPAWIWYPYGESEVFPEITAGNGRTAMAGPVFYYDATIQNPQQLPRYYDGTVFIYEWARNWIKEVKLDAEGNLLAIQPFAPTIPLNRPISMTIGPDGAIYMLEWGTGFGGNNEDAQLIRIVYAQGQRAPVISAAATPTSGSAPLTVSFSSEGTFDPDPGDALRYAWDFEDDGTVDATEANPTHTYTENGTYTARLTVSDDGGNTATRTFEITVGNARPVIAILEPVAGGFYDWGDRIGYRLSVSDAEDGRSDDGTLDCSTVTLLPIVGHDDHGHPLEEVNGCEASFETIEGHGDDGDLVFYVVEATYTDQGGASGAAPLTARAEHILHPKRLQAEHFDQNGGVQVEATGDDLGGNLNIGFIAHDEYIAFEGVNLHNLTHITYRVASAGTGGIIEARAGSPTGPLLSTAHVAVTGGWQTYVDTSAPIEDPGGVIDLYLVFKNNPGDDGLFNVNWIDLHGLGVREAAEGTLDGLSAVYYNNADFTGRSIKRVDAVINFNWDDGPPARFLGPDSFSAQWTGFLTPPESGAYTFVTRSDDGIRVWLDGAMIIDAWTAQRFTETTSQQVQLTAGQSYPIRVEYVEDEGEAQAHLLWEGPGFTTRLVPSRVFSPDAIGTSREADRPVATALTLDAVFPNPIRQAGTISYTLSVATPVTVEVYDLLGRRVEQLVDTTQPAGTYQLDLQAGSWASGMYICRVTTPSGVRLQPFMVVR